jgi:protein-disulfide isomerase
MSKKGRNASRQVKAMQAAQRRAEQRRRNLIIGGVAVAVIAVIVGIGIAVQTNRDETGSNAQIPAGTVDSYGIPRGDASAPVTVDLYEDFQCPICKNFEAWLGDTISKDVDAGQLRVVYHPVAFLDRMSTTDYSSRALETSACVLDQDGPDAWLKFHGLLYDNQPDENTAGLTDDQLASLAAQAGADKSKVAACQSAGTFDDWVKAATDAASKAHVTGTPTFRINGEDIPVTAQGTQAGAISVFQNAVDAAAGGTPSAPSSGGSSSTG